MCHSGNVPEECIDPTKRIEELKEKLRETDWIVVEILEFNLAGETPPHDFNEIYAQRQLWRKEIHELKGDLLP